VNIGSIIARCLSILAIVGLLAVQTSGPTAAKAVAPSDLDASMTTMVMDGMSMAMAGMEHCSGSDQAPPDCGKTCPWAVLCMASCVDNARSPELAMVASRRVASLTPVDDPIVLLWSDGPPARPPRT
jgi:hypothetical protein